MAESYLNKTGLSKLVEIIKNLFDKKLDKSGGTITGDLVVDGTITGDLEGTADMASRIPFVNYTGTSSAIVVNNVEGFPEVLTAGASIRIGIRSATFSSACTLNVNGTGASNIVYDGEHIGTLGILKIYGVYSFTFDGSFWRCLDAHQLRLGSSTVGSDTKPIYLRGGTPTTCSLGLSQVESVTEMPTTDLTEGRQVVKDGIVYTYSGGAWMSQAEDLGGRDEVHAEEFVFQPTGGADLSIKDCFASINRIKGNTVVWNQMFGRSVSYSSYYGMTITPNETEGTFLINGQFTGGETAYFYNVTSYGALMQQPIKGDIVLLRLRHLSGEYSGLSFVFESVTIKGTLIKKTTTDWRYLIIKMPVGSTAVNATFRFEAFDLTLMFGAGNEPTTVEEFEALFPEAYYEYNAGELMSFDALKLKSVGFNQYDGEKAKVIKGQPYYLGGTYESLQFKQEGEIAVDVAIPTDKLYTPESNGELYATGTDICINLSHSGYRNGEYKPYKEDELSLEFIKTIKDADGNVLFPEGLRSAGSAYDEIVYDEAIGKYKAIKRIGSVDMGTLTWQKRGSSGSNLRFNTQNLLQLVKNTPMDNIGNILTIEYVAKTWNDVFYNTTDKTIGIYYDTTVGIYDESYASSTEAQFKAAMSGKILQYELATPIEVVLDDISLGYDADDFGAEEVVSDGMPIIPMKADIKYNFNATDMIRGNYFAIRELRDDVAQQGREIDQLQYQLEGLDEVFIPTSQKGATNGVATLGADGKVPTAQLPNMEDDVRVCADINAFPSPADALKGAIYIDAANQEVYHFHSSAYKRLGAGKTASTLADGLMSKADKIKLNGIAANANNYTLPTASSTTLGGVKTTSSVTSASGYTACPIIGGVPYYKDTVGVDASVPTFEEHADMFDIDFSEHNTQYIEVSQGGGHSVNLSMPSSGVYRVTFANYSSEVLHLDFRNPGVGRFVIPQNPACDYGSAMSLVIVYVEGNFCSIAMDYPQIVVQ